MMRRMSLPLFVSFAATALAAVVVVSSSGLAQSLDVWIGTSRSQHSEGIYHCRLDDSNGKLSEPRLAAKIDGPGFLALHPDRAVLYAVGRLEKRPVVASYRIEDSDAGAPALQFLNAVPIGDGGAAHLAVDARGRTLITAQYGGGSIAVFGLDEEGRISARKALHEHDGASKVDARRQSSPHPHWVGFSPDNRFVFVPDLGADHVVIYAFDAERGELVRHGSGEVPAGAGPRHMKFDPAGQRIYVLNELALTITVFDYDASAGSMEPRQTIATLDADTKRREQFASASEIRVHPSGDFVYAANRGHDSIAAFHVDRATGRLSHIESEHVRGATPRNFNVSPSGKWLLAAGQHSHTLAAFAIDAATGRLTYNRSIVFAPSAICVLMRGSR